MAGGCYEQRCAECNTEYCARGCNLKCMCGKCIETKLPEAVAFCKGRQCQNGHSVSIVADLLIEQEA